MSFDGEAFVDEMRAELVASGRTLDKARWVERVVQGEATKEDLVGWARQHYHGVTYHTRRFLSIWLGRIPYEMTESVIENIGEEVLGIQSKSGHGHLYWLFQFTRALGAPDEVITEATPNVEAVLSESFLYNLAHQRPWYEFQFGASLGIENQIPPAYIRAVEGFKHHYGAPARTRRLRVPHHPHHGRRRSRWTRRRVRRAVPRHRRQASLGACRVLRRGRGDPSLLGRLRRGVVVVADHAIFFHDYNETDQPIVGGKCASLGAMTRAGLPVPPGFAVTTHAFADSMGRDHVGPFLQAQLDNLDVNDLHALTASAARCRQMVLDAGPFGGGGSSRSAPATANCASRPAIDDVAVAVRSSATAEDQPDASFAGQQDTYLWIRGADDVVNHVVRCWASLYTDRAIAYRHENGYPHSDVAMSVAVQQMVLPKAAGVAFTLNPTNGDRSTIVIDSAFGLGESVVSGIVTPDNYMIDKVIFEITKRTVSAKEAGVLCRG